MSKIQRGIGCARVTVTAWLKASKEDRDAVRKRRTVRTLIPDHATAIRAAQLPKSQKEGGGKYVRGQLFTEDRVGRVPTRQTVTRAAKMAAKEAGDPLSSVRGKPKRVSPRPTRMSVQRFAVPT